MHDAPITKDSDLMHGRPVSRGTRAAVKTIREYIEAGDSLGNSLERQSRAFAAKRIRESLGYRGRSGLFFD